MPPSNISHRSPSVDLAPHQRHTLTLLGKPMPGSPKPDILAGTNAAPAEAPQPDMAPNASLVLQLQSTFPVVPLDVSVPVFQAYSRYRQTQLTGRHVQPVDLTDPASRCVLELANRAT
ncbi:hypothetical protein [Plectonema phage Pbo-yong3]|uniref:hypothetical protein n=1 Tax=Plectonema phage Pbo-yong3 TaxID=2970324 RepID=UPI00403C6D66|nr:hypothetical protein [Plectonema phage Pbo-yong3]